MGPFVDEDHPLVKSGDGFVHDTEGRMCPLTFSSIFQFKGQGAASAPVQGTPPASRAMCAPHDGPPLLRVPIPPSSSFPFPSPSPHTLAVAGC
jgi:hypothetical protein